MIVPNENSPKLNRLIEKSKINVKEFEKAIDIIKNYKKYN